MITPKVLSDKYIENVYKLFEEKKWIIETDDAKLNTFDRFCQRMAELENDDDRDFMLDLSKDYLWIKSEQYEKLLIDLFDTWFAEMKLEFNSNNLLYICSLLPRCDFHSMKSSKFMIYLCQTTALRKQKEFHEGKILLFDNPGLLKKHLQNMNHLILIDDYIGSGETGMGCLDYIKDLEIEMEKVSILSLVAQKEGIELLEKQGVRVFAQIVRGKGISDRYSIEESKERLARMQDIGKKIKARKSMRLGFGDSEGLVTMIKTPNNTFPFYWYEQKNTLAPFPRRGNIKMISGEED